MPIENFTLLLRFGISLFVCLFATMGISRLSLAEQAQVKTLFKNEDSDAARWWLLEQAKKRVYLQTYILELDETGKAYLGKLMQLARRGVDVHLMVDGRGSHHFSGANRDYLQLLADAGVDVVQFNPLSVRRLHQAFGANHDKFIVSDYLHCNVDGRNISNSESRSGNQASVDVGMLIESKFMNQALVNVFQMERDRSFNRVFSAKLSDERRVELTRELETIRLNHEKLPHISAPVSTNPFSGTHVTNADIVNSPSRFHTPRFNLIREKFLKLVESSNKEIVIQNAYVVMTPETEQALQRAAQRGVRIILHTNSLVTAKGTGLPEMAFEAYWQHLLKNVPNIEIYTSSVAGTHLHSKAFVFDSKVAMVGSYNLDGLSDWANSEVVAVVADETISRRIRTNIVVEAIERSFLHTAHGRLSMDDKIPHPNDSCFELSSYFAKHVGKIATWFAPIL